jgi:hypothetical protein
MLGGDPVCLHRAAYWYAVGALELDPEPEPPGFGRSGHLLPLSRCGGWLPRLRGCGRGIPERASGGTTSRCLSRRSHAYESGPGH